MLHIIVGIAVLVFGLWGISTSWVISVEILKMLVFVGLVGFGIVAVLGGIRKIKTAGQD